MRTVSFYRFCSLRAHDSFVFGGLRMAMLTRLGGMGVVGRIYLAQDEGVNGHCSVPDRDEFAAALGQCAPELRGMVLNEAVEQGAAFETRRLHVRWRPTLVNCGAHEPGLEGIQTARAAKLSAAEWNAELENEEALLIDARNAYETEVGRMDGVRCETVGQGSRKFREQITQIVAELRERRAEQRRVLMFCTSGIRCEKLAAILECEGFANLAQLEGGVTGYVRTARAAGLPVKFRGRLFTFDDRLGADVSEEKLGRCQVCGGAASLHHNCGFVKCHNLNLQCEACHKRLLGACSEACMHRLLGRGENEIDKNTLKK